eukprot:8806430-Alexandrium_andersonii.AAC.1
MQALKTQTSKPGRPMGTTTNTRTGSEGLGHGGQRCVWDGYCPGCGVQEVVNFVAGGCTANSDNCKPSGPP